MSLFNKKKNTERAPGRYPPDEYKPVIRSSICTGEKTACMKELKTGRLTEIILIRSEADIAAFCDEYGVDRRDIETVY